MSPLEYKETRRNYLKSVIKVVAVLSIMSGFSIAISESFFGSGKRYWSLIMVFSTIGLASTVSAHNERLFEEKRQFVELAVKKRSQADGSLTSEVVASLTHESLVDLIAKQENFIKFNETHLWRLEDLADHSAEEIRQKWINKMNSKSMWGG